MARSVEEAVMAANSYTNEITADEIGAWRAIAVGETVTEAGLAKWRTICDLALQALQDGPNSESRMLLIQEAVRQYIANETNGDVAIWRVAACAYPDGKVSDEDMEWAKKRLAERSARSATGSDS